MGSRANSDLIYCIAWDESECFDDDRDIYDILEEIEDKYEEVIFDRWSSEHTETFYMGIKETHTHGDWDYPTVIDISKIEKIEYRKNTYNETLLKICEEFKLNYKEPKLIMLSTWE